MLTAAVESFGSLAVGDHFVFAGTASWDHHKIKFDYCRWSYPDQPGFTKRIILISNANREVIRLSCSIDSEDYPFGMTRASGDFVCPDCGQTLWDHPYSHHRAYDGTKYVKLGCLGELYKL